MTSTDNSVQTVKVLGRMMMLQCVYHQPGPDNKTTEKKFLKGIDKDTIQYIDTYVCPESKQIINDRSVVVERSGAAHVTYHTVMDIALALAGQERFEVGFKSHPHGSNI